MRVSASDYELDDDPGRVDTDAAVAKVAELGGREIQPASDTPYGRIGVVADNHGAVFSLIKPPAG